VQLRGVALVEADCDRRVKQMGQKAVQLLEACRQRPLLGRALPLLKTNVTISISCKAPDNASVISAVERGEVVFVDKSGVVLVQQGEEEVAASLHLIGSRIEGHVHIW
jgi:hypothetical protein